LATDADETSFGRSIFEGATLFDAVKYFRMIGPIRNQLHKLSWSDPLRLSCRDPSGALCWAI
jgi:hypothetical protein